jgi:hypothetical protein
MPATVRVAVVWLVYVDPVGVPLDTVAQPLVPKSIPKRESAFLFLPISWT